MLPRLISCFLFIATACLAEKPNVIFIFTDDQGSVDASCYGTEDIETPGIDMLARRGVRFTQFYAAAAVCSPSRAGLLTGRYPLRAGLTGNASSQKGHDGGMAPEQVTVAEIFKQAGYATAHIGKWHLGYVPEKMPQAQGFDHSFGHMGGCIDNYSHFFYWQGPNRHDLWRNGKEVFYDGTFFPDLMVDEAETFMRENKQKPFFIYFAMNVPHYPYQGSPEWLERYKKLDYPRNLYNAFVSTLDERIARLIETIDKLGLKEKTIIVYQSDHGHSVESRAHNGGGGNGPYRGNKFTLFEGGIRVPAVISWPGHLPEGEVRDQVGHSCDWLPTVAEWCGISMAAHDIDGLSLANVIRSGKAETPHKILHWQMGLGGKAQWAVREGPWKLIGNARKPADGPPLTNKDTQLFLANMDRDVSEAKNLADENPDVVKRLKTLHHEWVKEAQEKP